MKRMRALVVGGTGMLRKVSLWLAKRHDRVCVVARSRERLAALHASAPRGNIETVATDWHDASAFRAALADAGPFDLAVVWIHSSAPAAPFAAAAAMAPGARYFQVFGTVSASNRSVREAWIERLETWPDLRYRRVQLGRAESGSWLSHDEIAAGVIAAVTADAPVQEVGTVDP